MTSLDISLPSSFEESSPQKKQLLEQWILTNIDDGPQRCGLPLCFKNSCSFYLTELPDFNKWSPQARQRVLAEIVDRDMKEDLEKAGLINWCPNVSEVIPLNVPRDGNCLLHSISTAVWGIFDKHLIFRRLVGLALNVDCEHRFHGRWMRHRALQISQVVSRLLDSSSEEWADICQCLEPQRLQSAVTPYRFLEAIHVYTTANILRRPIIVITDPTARTFSGLSLQDNDLGGIYLPLEWNWGDINRSPVLLGYSQCHFTPLLFVKGQVTTGTTTGTTHKNNLIPLVNQRFEQLPLRFLLQGEEREAGEILRKYLKVTETVMQSDGVVQNVLCAEVEPHTLSESLNIAKEYFQHCLRQLAQQANRVAHLSSLQSQAAASPADGTVRFELQQTATPPQHVVRNHLQATRVSQYGMGDPILQTNPLYGQSEINIPAPSFTPHISSFLQQNASMNPPPQLKCVVPTCNFYGDSDTGMMCSDCFKNYTIKDSQKMAAASRVVSCTPSAPLPSMPIEEWRHPSMMSEMCRNRCGYRCSIQTHPFCHECFKKQKATAAARPSAALNSVSGLTPALPVSAEATQGNAGAVSNLNDLNRPSNFSRPSAGIPSAGEPATVPPPDVQSPAPAAAGKTPREFASPKQILEIGHQAAPLISFSLGNEKQLLGIKQSPASPQQPKQVTYATAAEASVSGTVHVTSTPPALPSLHSLQQEQRSHTGHRPENKRSEEAKLAEHMLVTSITGYPEARSCSKGSCNERALYNGLCAKCSIVQGINTVEVSGAKTLNSAPPTCSSHYSSSPATSPQGHLSANQEKNLSSSLNQLPQHRRNNHVLMWINEIWNKASKTTQPTGSPQLGLPERQESEPLKNDDLIQSGLECYSSTNRCLGCGAAMEHEGLCQQCKKILDNARLPTSGSVQETVAVQQKCLTDGCPFFGLVEHAGYCSECYAKLFSRELQMTRPTHTPIARHTVPLVRTHSNPPPPQAVPQNHGQHGLQCKVLECALYGDPKQNNMCTKHFQQYLMTFAQPGTGISQSAPVARQRSEVNITLPPNAQLQIMPGSASICMQNAESSVLLPSGAVGSGYRAAEGEPSVPVLPSQYSRSGPLSSVSYEPSLGETYRRVAGQPANKCRVLRCNNFGNVSKRGLCNSCAGNEVINDEVLHRKIFGEAVVDR